MFSLKNIIGRQQVTVPLTRAADTFFYKLLHGSTIKNDTSALIDGYGKNPYIYIVVDNIAKVVASMPRYFVNKNGEEVAAPDGARTFMQPNERESYFEFYYRVAANMLACGEYFVNGLRPGEGQQVWQMVAPIVSNVDIETLGDGEITRYSYHYFNKQRYVMPADMLHGFRPDITQDSLRGFSALRPGKAVYESDNELREAKASVFRNRGASGLIYSDGGRAISPTERDQQQQTLDSINIGNTDKLAYYGNKVGYIPFGIDGSLMSAVSKEDLSNLRDACRLFGIDSKLFGDPAASTYNNVAEAEKAAYEKVYLPLAQKLDEDISKFVLGEDISYSVNKGEVPILQESEFARAEEIRQDVAAGILTVNEARAMRYPELGDVKQAI